MSSPGTPVGNRPHRSITALSLLAVLAAGCEDSGITQVSPDIEVRLVSGAFDDGPLLEDGAVVPFGAYVLEEDDEIQPQIFRVENVGLGNLQIFEILLEGDDANEFVITQDIRQVIGPSGIDDLFIRYRPRTHGTSEATLSFRTTDPEARELQWTLRGEAQDPCRLAMSPSSLKFELGEERDIEIRTLTKSSCTLNFLDTDETLFRFQEPPQIPVTIEPDAPLVLTMRHEYFEPLLLPGEPVRQLTALAQHGQRQEINLIGQTPVFGCITVSPSEPILFPSTQVGFPVTQTVIIRNGCSRPVDIRGLKIATGDEEFDVPDDGLADGFTMPAFETTEFEVRFLARFAGNAQGNLRVLTADTRNPQFSIDLTGRAEPPRVDVFPRDLDFGTVTFRNPVGQPPRSECSSPAREVRLFPLGSADVVVQSLDIDSASDLLFVITSVTVDGQPVTSPTGPFVVPSGGDGLRVRIQFFPTRIDPAEHLATLRIRHNGEGGEVTVQLRGSSVPDIPALESFEQSEGPKVDILWVIDNSCSMADEQERLIENLGRFIDIADAEDADYQMGVTVTDGFSSESGKLNRCFPHPPVISGDYPDREAAFECTFLVGTDGSGIEAGLEAAKNALQLAQSDEENINSGFLREEADLAVVVMSDEEDQSPNYPGIIEFMKGVKGPGRESRVKVHAIAGPITGPCRDGSGFFSAFPGYIYSQATIDTGGIFFDICQSDWRPVLENLGLDTFQAFDTWYLEQVADPTTLVVTVDGRPVALDPADGYTYLFGENAIRFHGTSVPGPGQRIEVRYSSLCQP